MEPRRAHIPHHKPESQQDFLRRSGDTSSRDSFTVRDVRRAPNRDENPRSKGFLAKSADPAPETREAPVTGFGWIPFLYSHTRIDWHLKMFGTCFGMIGFFWAYFWLLRNPISPPMVMPLTWLDRQIPFQASSAAMYLSLWFYVSFAPALITSRRELYSYGVATTVLSVIGLSAFYLWPTTVEPHQLHVSNEGLLQLLKGSDAAGNACPSMHVAFAIFTAVWFERILRQMNTPWHARAVNWIWCLGILYSTLAIRQHVVLDVLAGTILGFVVVWAHLAWLNRNHRDGVPS